jgi:hypothetical protein
MLMFELVILPSSIALGLLAAMIIALELGYRYARRESARRPESSVGQVGAIQGALLGLLGLLLGFSFAGAASRFIERQDLIVQEANTIGTAYLRADMVDEPHATQIRQTLRDYVEHRKELSAMLAAGQTPDVDTKNADIHARLWRAARDGVRAKPEVGVVVLGPINEVIDLHSTRVYTGLKHLPLIIVWLLIICSFIAMAMIGYGNGIAGRRTPMISTALAILIAAVLWTTIDLDHPRRGLIRLSDMPLEKLELN